MKSETEYCEITDLATVRAAKTILQNIIPDCGHQFIPESEWQGIMNNPCHQGAALTSPIQRLRSCGGIKR